MKRFQFIFVATSYAKVVATIPRSKYVSSFLLNKLEMLPISMGWVLGAQTLLSFTVPLLFHVLYLQISLH